MKKKILIFLIIILVILAGICGAIKVLGPRYGIYLIPPSPKEYLETALSYMDQGIYAQGEEWQEAKETARENCNGVKNIEDTHEAILEAIRVAGGKHSTIIYPQDAQAEADAQTLPKTSFEDGILYILIPPYSAESNLEADYINVAFSAIKDHQSELKGVVIDLRDDVGGGMIPMLAAVSPFVPDGTLISFKYKAYSTDITLSQGKILNGGNQLCEFEDMDLTEVPVAVLQNDMTGSSGEVALLSLKGLPNVKTFGTGSAGYASANMVYTLYDGLMLQLTVAMDVDRFGNEYCEDPIEPDVYSENALEDAMDWLRSL